MRRGIELHLVMPETWRENDRSYAIQQDDITSHGLAVRRAGDVNRHVYANPKEIQQVVRDICPDLVDIQEEPFSQAAWQWLRAIDRRDLPAVMYTAQNIDKRLPPPFAQFERHAFSRVAALYPCSRQAASVARGKGFAGAIRVIPLGFDETKFHPGSQSAEDNEITLGLFGRLVPEKGGLDAVRILERVNEVRPARLIVVGEGPEASKMAELARSLKVSDRVVFAPWRSIDGLAESLRRTHIALVPSSSTARWVEQFGRIIVEAQAAGAVVAAYASGSIPDVIGETGILAAAGDLASVADEIVQLVGNEQEFQSIRKRGLAQCRSFTWDAVAEAQVDFYGAVISGDARMSLRLPASPRARREAAHAEFGPSAPTPAGTRPFALPVLQRLRFADQLASAIDWISESVARGRRRSVTQRAD